MAMMAIGEPQVSTVVGRVLKDTPAAKAGMIPGDKIVTIDGESVLKLDELYQKMTDKADKEVVLGIDRAGNVLNLKVKTSSEEGFSVYGESKSVGVIDGIIPTPRMTKVGVSDSGSAAGKAGFTTGVEIVSVNGQKMETFESLEKWYSGLAPASGSIELKFEVKQGESQKALSLAGKWTGDLGTDFGLYSSELFVDKAVEGSPAEKIGITHGDQLVAVNAAPIRSFFELRKNIQKAGEDHGKLNLTIVRAGKTITYEVIPQMSTERDPMLKKLKQYTVGVMPIPSMMEPVMVTEQTLNPILLVYKGTSRMLDLTARNLISIGKMVQGQVSVKSLGGPILIGKLAGDSINRGLMDFLKMMGILSIGLGVLNILPIPVLDGGHIVLLMVEAIRGRALSLKQMEIAQQVGLVFILLIMIVVMKNDISRLPIFN
jgi:regulator of sigma E protease